MKPFEAEKRLLPDFGRTPHLPWNPNGTPDDVIASETEAKVIFSHQRVLVEEKIDGSCVGIHHTGKEPIIRNRTHILRKGYEKDTTAKLQFRPLWGWYYEHKGEFENLNELLGEEVSVYGEWCYATHTIPYNALPSLFIAHTVYDPSTGNFVDGDLARRALTHCGFQIPELIRVGVGQPEDLYELLTHTSAWSQSLVEGVYIKVCNGEKITHRFKMVRPDFHSDPDWVNRPLVRNKLINRG